MLAATGKGFPLLLLLSNTVRLTYGAYRVEKAAHGDLDSFQLPPGHTHGLQDVDYSSSARAASSQSNGFLGGILSGIGSLLGTVIGTLLSPTQQNGNSLWGLLSQQPLPAYKTGSGTTTPFGFPWGLITTGNTNPYTGMPNTNVLRVYNLKVTTCNIQPDGVTTTQGALCINGQFPGPLIEANYGDIIRVTVTNGLTNEGTSMHWHGFLQTNTNEEDGVPGVTQCPIAPGASFTYLFRATLYGTSWYHTHYSAQYAGGAVGPIVVYGPHNSGYDVDLGPVMLQEWYHDSYDKSITNFMRPLSKGGPILPIANSNLINGKMRYPCSATVTAATTRCLTADYSKFNFTSGKNHRLRLVNTGAAAIQKFSIDGHTMEVIANDFMPVTPYNTSMVALGVGQRADVVVYGSGKPTDIVWMRSNIVACSLNDGLLTEARGIIYYQNSDHKSIPTAPANQGPGASTSLMSCGNDPLTQTIPAYPLAVANNPVTQTWNINMKSNGTNMIFYFGNNSFMVNYNDPIVSDVLFSNLNNFNPRRNVFNAGSASSVRAIIYNYDDAPHPIHLHGHNMQVLQLGMGKWDNSIVRPKNPQRRDVIVMPPALSTTVPSYVVIQWGQDNPGVWALHCHFAWHSSMGLLATIVERPADVPRSLFGSASVIAQTCLPWNAWLRTFGLLTTGIDSGLKRKRDGPTTSFSYDAIGSDNETLTGTEQLLQGLAAGNDMGVHAGDRGGIPSEHWQSVT